MSAASSMHLACTAHNDPSDGRATGSIQMSEPGRSGHSSHSHTSSIRWGASGFTGTLPSHHHTSRSNCLPCLLTSASIKPSRPANVPSATTGSSKRGESVMSVGVGIAGSVLRTWRGKDADYGVKL